MLRTESGDLMDGPIIDGFELCLVVDCEEVAQVIIDIGLVTMGDEGVEDLGTVPVAMCRQHALEEQEAAS